MLSPRSVILLSVVIFIVSLLLSLISMLGAPDSNGAGRDSYGVKAYGFRAIFESLRELGISAERSFPPPRPDSPSGTLVLLAPDMRIAGLEPTYIRALVPWIQGGGRLVVANRVVGGQELLMSEMQRAGTEVETPSIWESLELPEVEIFSPSAPAELDFPDDLSEEYLESWVHRASVTRVLDVEAAGTFRETLGTTHRLTLPGNQHAEILVGETSPSGQLIAVSGDGESHLVAAEFPKGQGHIVVVADAALFSNRLLSQTDNSVVATRLLAGTGAPVIFDEYFHGLGVRGNPFFLMTRPGYAALALGLLLFVCLSAWRKAVLPGPPLADDQHPRRDVREYIDAMAAFFMRGKASRRFLVQRLRAGVLRELCIDVSLPPETQDVDLVVSALSRQDPQRAARVRSAFQSVDTSIHDRHRWGDGDTLDAMRQLTACLRTELAGF